MVCAHDDDFAIKHSYIGFNTISHTMKIWERIIDRRLREGTIVGEEQFDFMPGKGTTNAMFAARQVIEKHREMQVFIDLEKAYDSVHDRKFGGV